MAKNRQQKATTARALGKPKPTSNATQKTLPCTDEKGDTPVVNDDQDRYGKINPYCLEGLCTTPDYPPKGDTNRRKLCLPASSNQRTQTAPRPPPAKSAMELDRDRNKATTFRQQFLRKGVFTAERRPLQDAMNRLTAGLVPLPKRVSPSYTRKTRLSDSVLVTKRNAELGRLWVTDNNLNILSEHQLMLHGIDIIKKCDGSLVLTDRSGRHYPFRVVNTKFIITIGKYDNAGTLQTVDFIIDGACPFNIISEDNARKFGFDEAHSTACISVSGFGNAVSELRGGFPWYVVLKDESGEWKAPKTQITHLKEAPITDAQMALLLESFSFNDSFVGNVGTYNSRIRTEQPRANTKNGVTDSSDVKEIDSSVLSQIIQQRKLRPIRAKVTTGGDHGTVMKTPEIEIQERAARSQAVMDTMNASRTVLNEMVKRGMVPDGVAIRDADEGRTMDRHVAGGKTASRVTSAGKLSQKQRVPFEPFHLVFCDAYEGMDEVCGHNTGHRYVIRFVDSATGYKKDYTTRTKDKFVEAFSMFLAWVKCVAPIIEKHRQLPKGHIRVRVLCSDRDSNFTTIYGATRTEFDELAVKEEIHRYFADTDDSCTAGAVESTFGTSTRHTEESMLVSGLKEELCYHAWVDDTDKSNYLPTTSNRLGQGEPPNATLGFSTDMSRFQRFGCPGTVQVAHMKLYVRDDGSVSKTPPQSRIGQGRGGKVSRIKSLPCFYLRTGGGLNTNESHKMYDFGG